MKKILVIENEQDDFDDIKENFSDWDIYPDSPSDITNFNLESLLTYVLDSLKNHDEIVALIIDISLLGRTDETGIELIREIRNFDDENSLKNKIIPIFCYSRHDQFKDSALKAGATNFFSKHSLSDKNSKRFKFLRQSLQALAFLYVDAIGHAQRLSKFEEILENLHQTQEDNVVILRAVLQLQKFNDLDELLSDNKIEDSLTDRLGQETVNQIKEIKLTQQNKEDLENQLEEISGILSSIPGLSPFAGILKGIKLLSKSMW